MVGGTQRDGATGTLVDVGHLVTDALDEIGGEIMVIMNDVCIVSV
jgi:hypothetical protein